MIDERQRTQRDAEVVSQALQRSGWGGLYFGGVAFKYQRSVDDLSEASRIALKYMDVVTTSGPGTGYAAHIDKIRNMKEAIGDAPLAIASGITAENVKDYLPHSDCYLVATGISASFEEFDPRLVKSLIHNVRSFGRCREEATKCALCDKYPTFVSPDAFCTEHWVEWWIQDYPEDKKEEERREILEQIQRWEEKSSE